MLTLLLLMLFPLVHCPPLPSPGGSLGYCKWQWLVTQRREGGRTQQPDSAPADPGGPLHPWSQGGSTAGRSLRRTQVGPRGARSDLGVYEAKLRPWKSRPPAGSTDMAAGPMRLLTLDNAWVFSGLGRPLSYHCVLALLSCEDAY